MAGDITRALDTPGECRCFLLHGADEAGSRALAARVPRALGADAERIELTPAQLRSDPALLADEAAAGSLFGTPRFVRVDGAADDCVAAVEALLAAPAAGNPVVLVAAASLKRDSRLVQLVANHRLGRAHESRALTAETAAEHARSIARELGLRLEGAVGERLVAATGGDRALLTRELEKLALFLDAGREQPRAAGDDALDAIGVDASEGDLARLLDAVLAGDEAQLDRELARAGADGTEGITLIRAALRRFGPLAAARAEIDRGTPPGPAIARSVFGRDRDAAARDLPRWSGTRLALAMERLGQAERALKQPGNPGPVIAAQLLVTLARSTRRR